jgi:hypothetical protein
MPTYYEILQLGPTATVAEIEAACDAQYNHWRRLVTHHDQSVVNQANQQLQLLETIRATLTHPEQRAAYNAHIQVGNSIVGGLGDPQAMPRAGFVTPPPPAVSAPPSQSSPATLERVDVWLCPKCQTVNAPGNAYCKQCGHTIGIRCPKCAAMVEALAAFCSHCGANIATAARQKELETTLTAKQQALAVAERPIPDRAAEIKKLRHIAVSAGAWLIWVFSGLVWLYSDRTVSFHPSPSVILGVQMIALVGWSVLQRAFSFSAFLVALFFVVDFVLGGNVIYHRTVYTFYMVDLIGVATLIVYGLALLNIGSRSREYRRGARLLVRVALLAKLFSLVFYLDESDFLAVSSTVEAMLGEGIVTLQNATLLPLLDAIQVIVLCILTLRTWWLALHFAHKVAAARLTQRQQVEQLQSEIRQMTQELQSLGRA